MSAFFWVIVPKSYTDIAFTFVNDTGRVPAALCVRDSIRSLSPEYIILTGIAAADPKTELRLGYIAYSTEIVDYELQKLTPEGIEYRLNFVECSTVLINLVKDLQRQN